MCESSPPPMSPRARSAGGPVPPGCLPPPERIRITLPPLRERNNIFHLANEFLPEASMELGRPCRKISEAAAQVLLRYHWPGNVRELRTSFAGRPSRFGLIEPEHFSVLPVDAPLATALRGEPAPLDSSLKRPPRRPQPTPSSRRSAKPSTPGGEQERGGATPPHRLQHPAPQDEAVRH